LLRYKKKFTGLRLPLAALLITICYGVPVAANDVGSVDQVKAAYIYNLLKFTSWPESALQNNKANINVCLSGAPNPVAKILADELRGRTIQNKSLIVIYIPEFSDNPDEETANNLMQCQLLYLSEMTISREQYLTEYSQTHSIIAVSDKTGFARRNGMVELEINAIQRKVSLIINMSVAHNANIIFSSKLLQLAELIKDQSQ